MVAVGGVIAVRVEGVRETIVALHADLEDINARALQGLLESGRRVRDQAKANVQPYNYNRRLHDNIRVWTSIVSPTFISVNVGLRGNTFAPEGKTFEIGWHSKKGLQPPVEPFTEWVIRRGIEKDPKKAKHVAYVMARAQGGNGDREEGYSFGERHWLSDAWALEQLQAAVTVERYALSNVGWMAQARVPEGQAGGGRFL